MGSVVRSGFGRTRSRGARLQAGSQPHHALRKGNNLRRCSHVAYDVSKPVTLAGQVTFVNREFPHVVVGLRVARGADAGTMWEVETLNPQGLQRAGIGETTLKANDTIRATVFLARNQSRRAVTQTITLPNGRTIDLRVGAGALIPRTAQ